ncbi:MAG: hypothetical protein K6L76_11230 [Agarilytica sp.]
MSEELYDVVFGGELVRRFELDVVKKNLGQLFKMDAAKVEALFSGKKIVLKRKLNFDTATKYRVAIKKAGALVDLVEVSAEEANAAPTAKPQGKAVFGERAPGQAAPAQGVSRKQAPSDRPPLPTVEEHVSDDTVADGPFSLAPVGTEVLKPNERKEDVEVSVDVSALSIKEASGDLLDASEKHEFVALDIDLSAFDVAEVGADVLKENERKKVAPMEVDTSAMSVAEPGATLGSPKPAPPPAPDVSKIHLAGE